MSWWKVGFISDYVFIAIIMGMSFYVDSLGPYIRPIDLTDKDLSHPNLPNIVSNVMLFVYSVIVPLAVIVILSGVRMSLIQMGKRHPAQKAEAAISCIRDLHHFVVGLALAVSFTKLVTDFLK
ncbi:hypothetical protein HDU97_007544 [Phlyctochytrium planicorne]|nr:hypothetical protein HDU97_007544 [Phlyctochytrium planicorne]